MSEAPPREVTADADALILERLEALARPAVSAREAAEILCMSLTTFKTEAVPVLPRVRLSAGRVAYLRRDLVAYLEERREEP